MPPVTMTGIEKHRHRMFGDLSSLDAKEGCRLTAVEFDAQIGDVSVRPDLLSIYINGGHDLIKRSVGQVRRLVRRRIVHFRPQQPERLALREPPTTKPCRLRVLRCDIHVQPADLEGVRGVERKDAAVGALQLGVDGHAEPEGGDH